MDTAKKILNFQRPPEEVLETFTCSDCEETVQKIKTVYPAGPQKGETLIYNRGCKCEDIRLAKEAVEQRKKLRTEKFRRMFDANSLINKSLQRATFDNYEPTSGELKEAKGTLETYAKEFDRDESHNLLLVGSYGTGKSHLSVAVTKVLIQNGFSAVFLSVPKLLTKIKNTYNQNSEFSENDLLEVIQDVDLLVLDDLGTEHAGQKETGDSWTHSKLFEVLDSRSGKPTIFTTNLTGSELEKKMNERNMSRMMDNTHVIKMNGKDYRRKQF